MGARAGLLAGSLDQPFSASAGALGRLAAAVEKAVDRASNAHVDETLLQSLPRSVKPNSEIAHRDTEACRNLLPRFFEKVDAPDHFGILRFKVGRSL